jgi:hypothetical protein
MACCRRGESRSGSDLPAPPGKCARPASSVFGQLCRKADWQPVSKVTRRAECAFIISRLHQLEGLRDRSEQDSAASIRSVNVIYHLFGVGSDTLLNRKSAYCNES